MEKKNAAKVSVLIPAFNEAQYINKTLKAILRQDYSDFEVIVVNNASTDATEEIVKNFIAEHKGSSDKIRLVFEARRGTNNARECGRKLATGDIIAQLDADCIPSANWISKAVRQLQRNNVIAVTGPYDYYDSNFFRRQLTLLAQFIFYPFINAIVQLNHRGGIIIGGNSFIDAAVLEKAGGYNVDLTFYGDDIDIAKRISPFGWIAYAPHLILETSSRRFAALGFGHVQKKYRKAFFDLIFLKGIKINESIELIHPR